MSILSRGWGSGPGRILAKGWVGAVSTAEDTVTGTVRRKILNAIRPKRPVIGEIQAVPRVEDPKPFIIPVLERVSTEKPSEARRATFVKGDTEVLPLVVTPLRELLREEFLRDELIIERLESQRLLEQQNQEALALILILLGDIL